MDGSKSCSALHQRGLAPRFRRRCSESPVRLCQQLVFDVLAVEGAGSPEEIPAEVCAVASMKIFRIQGAIASFGEDDIGEVHFRRRGKEMQRVCSSRPRSRGRSSRRSWHRRKRIWNVSNGRQTSQAGGSHAGPVAVLGAELSRARAELAQLKGGANLDALCGPSVKRTCRTGKVRGAIPAMPT